MSIEMLAKRRQAPRTRRGEIAHPQCPIEQTLRGRDDAASAQLAQYAWQPATAPEGSVFVADHQGLRVLATSEGVLVRAVDEIARRFAGRVVARPPAVRYVPGNPVLEPYMTVVVSGPERYLPLVQKDMTRRRGRVARADERGGAFMLEAEAPLADLIGYGDWLAGLMDEQFPHASAWLSRYLPVDDGGPRAA
jgi:hypothetical protein